MTDIRQQLSPQEYRYILRRDFPSFLQCAFYQTNPQTPYVSGKHIELIAAKLEACRTGKIRRLIINIPPRNLKSICASIAFPAWLLGHNPAEQIICASYGQDLADKLARDTRNVMYSPWYQSLFPTRIIGHTVSDFTTSENGNRMATSVGGVLTGRGANFIILDDPLKPDDAMSEVRRQAVNDWYDNSLVSRLNDKASGCITVVMQRLHQDDLVGHIIERDDWDILSLPAIADTDEAHTIESFTTTGDRIQDRRLLEAGGKGLFTKELDEALFEKRIDAAIHSMKDLPTRLPPGLVLACVPSREDPRDAFISRKSADLMTLPRGAVIGTASLRRQAQALYLRPDLRVITLRGSVQTRLKKIGEGEMDATFLALAGLTRLGMADLAVSLVPLELMPSAAGQGALAITCRADDKPTLAALARLSIQKFEIATMAERAFLDALDGSCRTPIGAMASVNGHALSFIGEVLTPDGSKRWRRTETIDLDGDPYKHADAVGRRLGSEIRSEAGLAYQPDRASGW